MLPAEKRIRSKKDCKEWLTYELKNYGTPRMGALARLLRVNEYGVLTKFHILLRKTEYYTNTKKKLPALFYKLRLGRLETRYCLHIPVNCCAKGLRVMHVGPVLMNKHVQVGEDCAFHINTSLVAGGTSNESPVLGKGVVLGVGAVVLGGVQIADYVAVGANAVVNKSVTEENIAVAGVPAKKVSDRGRLDWNKKD